MARDFKPLANAINYFQEIGPELYRLEQEIKRIKNSKEYLSASNLLSTYCSRGLIDQAPSYKNGYQLPTTVDVKEESQSVEKFLENFLDKTE